MACPHFSISYRQRSKGQSAVAGSAYQNAEKLFSEYDSKFKDYRYKAEEVFANGILLPPNAPPEYADRQILWNAAEAVEKQWNSQLARGIIIALPREIPADQYEELIREYCMKEFVSKGMIADYAIHDKHDGNPHAHIMLTLRAMDENGKWLTKCRKVYVLDENGERIKLPTGEWKSYKEPTVDWNDHSKAEIWRTAWADLVNLYLERNNRPERIDLRSYERQEKEELPTIHLGPAITHMEEKGIQTEIGDYNRQIKKHNRLLSDLKKFLLDIGNKIRDLIAKTKELRAPKQPVLILTDYVSAFIRMRKAGRADWSMKGRETASVSDVKFFAAVMNWMEEKRVQTLEDLREYVASHQESFDRLTAIGKELRSKNTAIKHLQNYEDLLPIYRNSQKGFKSAREKYARDHKEELDTFNKANRFMKVRKLTPTDLKRIKDEKQALLDEKTAIKAALMEEDIDPDFISMLVHCVNTVTEAKEPVEHEESLREKLRNAGRKEPEKKIGDSQGKSWDDAETR